MELCTEVDLHIECEIFLILYVNCYKHGNVVKIELNCIYHSLNLYQYTSHTEMNVIKFFVNFPNTPTTVHDVFTPAFYRGCPSSIPGHSMWVLWLA
jgi:hypothetical protein